MTQSVILSLIIAYSIQYGVDPKVAVAVAMQESSLNPDAIGEAGEIGLYQIMPRYAKNVSIKQLKDPRVNIRLGIKKLKEVKDYCNHQEKIDWLVCYNYVFGNAKRVKHPRLFPYVKHVQRRMDKDAERKLASLVDN